MSRKVSLLNGFKELLGFYDDESITSILSDNSEKNNESIEEDFETREFRAYDHYYIKEVHLPTEKVVIPEGYEIVTYVDRNGYRLDKIDGINETIYVEYANVVPVVARTVRFKPPYGMNGYKYYGKPINKEIGGRRR